MIPRTAGLDLSYNNVNITSDLKPHLIGWTYTDNMSGQADDLSITLEDRGQLWSGSWMPDKGASLTPKIVRSNWLNDGKQDQLALGKFEVDEINTNHPPSTVTISATPIPVSSSLRGQAKNRAWEKTELSVVARDIATGAKLKFYYETDYDPEYDRIEQTEEADLPFLQRLCDDAGLCLKVTNGQIAIFDERKYEAASPVATITNGKDFIIEYSGKSTMTGLYKSCVVEYQDPDSKQTIRASYTPPKPPPTDRVLYVNERVPNVKTAEILAQKRLREANKQGISFSITLLGDIRLLAALTVKLSGFGKFDGKYIITQAVHGQSDGYQTSLQLRKCLEGY